MTPTGARCVLYGAVLQHLFGSTQASEDVCVPLTLKINDKVRHRPRHVTIAHRGAAAHLPEHTTAGYRLALELGADFVEPDLLVTADRQLVALHSMDLAAATDVETKFADRQPWFSPWANRTGYWVFNFTAAEVSTLRVKQTIEDGRSTAYDYLWGVPTLDDVLQTVIQWNNVDLPQRMQTDSSTTEDANQPRKPTPLQLAQSGIYAELKDTLWLEQEAGIDVVDLLLEHIQQDPSQWESLLPCFDELQFDAFKVPGLAVQSFDPQALTDFSEKWKAQHDATLMPEPPYVLLVDKEQCEDPEFWFKVGDSSRKLLSGIGCNKDCLIANEPYTLTSTKAEEFSLEVHAWTERPENDYVSDRFANELEEMEYLYCHVGIQGVFSESVSSAVTAAYLPCDGGKRTKHNDSPMSDGTSDDSPKQFCYDSADEAGFFTAMAAFVMGTFITSLFFIGYGRHYIRWQSTAVPSAAEDGGVPTQREVQARHGNGSHHDDTTEEDDHWVNTASAVDEWRSAQLAAAEREDGESRGLELT